LQIKFNFLHNSATIIVESQLRKRMKKKAVNAGWTDLSGCIPREMSRQRVDRALPRECGRSYMRIGKIFTLETRIVTTAITDRGCGRKRLVTVLIVSSSCCYRAEWPAILRTIDRRWRATCFVPRAFSGRFA